MSLRRAGSICWVAGFILVAGRKLIVAIPSIAEPAGMVADCRTEFSLASAGVLCANTPVTFEILVGAQCPFDAGCHDLAIILGLSEAGDAQRADQLTKLGRSLLSSLDMARNRPNREYSNGMVVTFSHTTGSIVQAMTGDEMMLLDSIDGLHLRPGRLGEQGLAAALGFAQEGIESARLHGPLCAVVGLPQVVVVVTDAWPGVGMSLERAIAELRLARISIMVICSGPTCDKDLITAVIGDDMHVFVDGAGGNASEERAEDAIHDKGLEKVIITATMAADVELGPGLIDPPATRTGQSLVWDLDGWLGHSVTATWPVLVGRSGDDVALIKSIAAEFHLRQLRRAEVVRATFEPTHVAIPPCDDPPSSATATRMGTGTVTPSSTSTRTAAHASATPIPTQTVIAEWRVFAPYCDRR